MHLTVRMAWHDNNWNGKVCCDPEGNTYCTGAHSLLSGRIEKQKNLALENAAKDQYVADKFNSNNVPPCYWSINAFSDRDFKVEHHHAFRRVKHTIPDTVKPYSVFTWPFKLSFVHTEEDKRVHGDYWPDLEQRIKDFTGKFKKDESIIFFYANYDNPVSADDMKYLLLGASVVNEVVMPEHFPFTKQELERMGKGKAGSPMKNFPTLNWSIQVTHQNDKAVLLPYKEYIKHVEQYPEEFEKLNDIKVVIDEPSLVRSFKYVAMDIDDDKCLYLLYKLRKAIFKVREHNRQVVTHNLEEEEKRLDAMIEMVWKSRGIYPSLQKVLKYFLKKDCTALSNAIKSILTKDFDLMDCFDDITNNKIPKELNNYADDFDDLLGKPEFKRHYKAFLKLSLFNLTEHQIKRIITEYHKEIIKGLENNPYLIYEYYEPDPPKNELDIPDLVDEPIDVYKIDVGMIPDSRFVKRHRKIQNIRESSPERIRSLIIEYLWSLEGSGHTYDNLRSIIKNIKEHPLIFHTQASIDENGILDLEDVYKSHFQERLHIEPVEQEKYIYLKELYRAEERIKEKIEKLINRKPHPDTSPDFKKHIDDSVADLKKKIKDFDETLFRAERQKLYENIFSRSLFLLTGKPGSGKTYEISHIIKHLKSLNQGLEILAPTGKAALRISENIKNNTGLDIKADTIDRYIFEKGFWWAYEDWDRLHDLPENEKLTVTNLIIDESSMIDLQKLYILFSIIKFTDEYPKRIIFVGDENQLPPIGFGKPFHDIISHIVSKETLFEKHYIQLATNCRQENDLNIIKLAEAFSDKTRYFEESLNLLYKKGKVSDGLEIYYWKTKEELQKAIKERIKSLIIEELTHEVTNIDKRINEETAVAKKEYLKKRKDLLERALKSGTNIQQFNLLHGLYENGYVPFVDYDFRKTLMLENLQLLSPYRPGFFGVLGLNKLIQKEFRDTSFKDTDTAFYHADKLIRVSNYYRGYGRNKSLILSNGSIGVINNHKGGKTKYYFRDADKPLEWVDDEEQFDLAYSITVHKAQGSDFSNVFLVIPNKLNMLNRELIYTALTRSKQRLFLFIYDEKENLLVKSKGVSALLTRQSSIFEKPEDKLLKYYPRKGDKPVRSKGEYIIHKALQRSGLKFEYEEELRLEKLTYPIYPDFVVKLEDGTKIYWEHLGMLDIRKYFNDWMKRRKDYIEHNLFDFVVTTDDMNGIKEEELDKVIDDIRNKNLKQTLENRFSNHHYQLY
jgi:ATP-dependent exoDNAse (exonuclease V), alpha subunit - helicase superfamily I member